MKKIVLFSIFILCPAMAIVRRTDTVITATVASTATETSGVDSTDHTIATEAVGAPIRNGISVPKAAIPITAERPVKRIDELP